MKQAITLSLIIVTTTVSADLSSAADIRAANKAIKKEEYQKADNIYSKIPNDSGKIIFNKGYLKAASRNYEQSADYYKLIELSSKYSNKLKAKALFNLGNDNLKQMDIDKAISNYKKALILDPGNKKIIYNLEVANNAELVKNIPQPKKQGNKNQEKQKDGEKEKKKSKGKGNESQEKQDQGRKNAERILDSFKDDELHDIQEKISKQELQNNVEKDW